MSMAVITAAGISALAVFFFLAEGDSLSEGHARTRTQILNAARWAVVIVLTWALIPAATADPAPQRGPTILGLALLIGATMLVPVRWFVRLGGIDPAWEMRRSKIEVAQLATKLRRRRGSVSTLRLREAIARIESLRSPEKCELCDLLVAQLDDLVVGAESWNESGRRSIRIDEISRELWPDDMPQPDFDPDEATFRWHFYRAFGSMIELGLAEPSRSSLDEFGKLRVSLEEFRRDDTFRFVDAVWQSADRWLAQPSISGPWITSFDFETLGPDGLAEVRKIWGRDAAMWGARLDDDDRVAIAADLARRAATTEPATEPATKPADEQVGPAAEQVG
jgi:hypothetical protein